jgi:hypothetical protein
MHGTSLGILSELEIAPSYTGSGKTGRLSVEGYKGGHLWRKSATFLMVYRH